MFDKPQSTHTLGLELDADQLNGVALSLYKGKPRIDVTFTYTVTPTSEDEGNVNPLYTEEQKKELQTLTEKYLSVTALDTKDVLVRPLDLKITKEKDIDAVLSFQSEPILPYPAENAIIDRIILSQDKEGSKLSILAARKDHVENHLKTWNALLIEPEATTAAPAALALFAKQYVSTENPLIILHLGITHSLCILLENGKLVAAQTIPTGVNDFISALKEVNQISLESARQLLSETDFSNPENLSNPSLKNAVETLKVDITRTIYAISKQSKGKEISDLFVTGIGAIANGLPEILCKNLNKTLVHFEPEPGTGLDRNNMLRLAIPIGAALNGLPNCKEEVNFRQHEYAFPDPWKRLKLPVFTYLALCLGAALALILFGKAYENYQEGKVRLQYIELLNVMNKPYDSFEKEFAAKQGVKGASEAPPLNTLTLNELNARLSYLEKELNSTPSTYPLFPNIPLVSDVLAWLSTHQHFVFDKLQEGNNKDSLKIESFNYQLVRRPEPTKRQEKYQVKVELEFSSPTPKAAREFHDALIAPNDFVDPKGEIKWNANKDKYRTSFFLKDKTAYPPL